MCGPNHQTIPDEISVISASVAKQNKEEARKYRRMVAFGLFGAAMLFASSILAAILVTRDSKEGSSSALNGESTALSNETFSVATASSQPPVLAVVDIGENPCTDKDQQAENPPSAQCIIDAIQPTGTRDVTRGARDEIASFDPLSIPFREAGLCPVNVHWYVGANHFSWGEYDNTGTSPSQQAKVTEGTIDTDDEEYPLDMRSSSGGGGGLYCRYYDETDPKFTTPYEWQHCTGMEVGETYEVHWPHSAAGDCGTPYQYQTPFSDGIFCRNDIISFEDDTAQQIGVQAQVFTIVNDESYYFPYLYRGMLVDAVQDKGTDLAIFTAVSSSREEDICSTSSSAITWHVDRKCHLISASSFDQMCQAMKDQADDMSNDMAPHIIGSTNDFVPTPRSGNERRGALRG
jgi:hypothetical protein